MNSLEWKEGEGMFNKPLRLPHQRIARLEQHPQNPTHRSTTAHSLEQNLSLSNSNCSQGTA